MGQNKYTICQNKSDLIYALKQNHDFYNPFKSFCMETFSKRMVALHKERKTTQKELAKLLSTSISVIDRYERDKMKPHIDIVT